MSSEWQTTALGECVTFLSGNTPSKSNPDFWGPGTSWITAKDMKSFWVESAEDTLTQSGVGAASRIVQPGTTLLLTRGMTLHNDVPIVRTRFVAAFNQDVKAVVPQSGVLSEYVPYLLLGNKARLQSLVDSAGHGTGRLNSDSLKALEVKIPSINEQHTLALFFSAFDDRIALLRETNATLEAIAQALFKSWFVDFEPVHAKARGEPPQGMDDATAALFPDSFEESELGMIPKGWKVGCVSNFAQQKKGSVNPQAHPATMFEHYSLPAFDNGQAPVKEMGEEIRSNKTPLPAEAVLLSKLNPHIPRVWLPVIHAENAVCSTEFLAFGPVTGSSKEFLYCLFKSAYFLQSICQLVTGTSNSHQRVKPDQVSNMTIILPPSDVLAIFTEIARPMFERIYNNRQQAQTLAQLRDTLLPKLISGQLRLPEAEALLAEELP